MNESISKFNLKGKFPRYSDPEFKPFVDCYTRTVFSGIGYFWLGFSGFYFAQKIIQQKIPYNRNLNLLISFAAAGAVSYKLTNNNIENCKKSLALLNQENKN
uniref:Uncharacterized protein n=1 Tax=Megaselia scalaris TaxID=36166 RepID=T1GZT4_MEGSC